MAKWYVLQGKPLKELVVRKQLLAKGVENFCPMIRVRRANPRARTMVPYFPGYLFIHVDLESEPHSTFQWMPHTVGLVSFGGIPASVPTAFITTLQEHLEQINSTGQHVSLRFGRGDTVVVAEGPFAGYEAIFDTSLNGGDRARVLLKMLNDRYITMDVRADWL